MKSRESFVFYSSFYYAIKDLNNHEFATIFRAICEYALTQNTIELDGVCKTVFTLIKPQLDANYKKFVNGCKDKQISKQEAKQKQKKANDKQTVSKHEANDNVNVNDNVNDNVNEKENTNIATTKISKFIPPTVEEVISYFAENGANKELALKAHSYYQEKDWKDKNNKPVLNWKNKMNNSWLRPESIAKNKLNTSSEPYFSKPFGMILGEDERWDYDTGKRMFFNYEIPINARPRPSKMWAWNHKTLDWYIQ